MRLVAQPVQDGLGSLFRLFLLYPMAAIETDDLHIWHQIAEVLGAWDTILLAVNHQSRMADDRIHIRQNMPVSI